MTNNHVLAGERALQVLDAIRRDGKIRCSSNGELRACIRLHVKGILARDPKDGNQFTFTAKGPVMHGKTAEAPATAQPEQIGEDHATRTVLRRRIDSIDIGTRLRPVDQQAVDTLKPSIAQMGLQTPISVFGKPSDATVSLAAGGHRLEAMRQLGKEWIDCFHQQGDALDAALWEIDENLIRLELTAADKALFMHRRKEIHLLKHPETAQHTAGGRARHGSAGDKLSFAESTAKATGQNKRTIERDAARGARIIDMALHLVRGTRLDSGVFLDRLKLVPEEDQVLYVKAALKDEKQKAADTKENRKAHSVVRHAVRLTHMAHVTINGAAKAGRVDRKFPIIYADPPWRFGVYSEVTGREKSPENHYPTMNTHAICGLFEQIGSPAKADSVLFLWATNPMLLDALKVMDAWGFTYVHHWIWDKERAGTGYWGRDRHELLLIGKKGSPVAPLQGDQPNTVHREVKGQHSAKPEFFAETIERLYPGLPKLEMFSRSARPGWTPWGFEAPHAEAAE
jgi:N6-adenosine-specific RNA methylase IME4/ParB-like chromosome segregation protein Spo0J